jgi:serine/threonine protein kinase
VFRGDSSGPVGTTFLDLLRAKVAIQLSLLDPAGAQDALREVDGGKQFLALLPQGDRERVEEYARRCHTLKGESFYLRFLREKAVVPEQTLHPILWEVRQSKKGDTLGQTLVARGMIELAIHQDLNQRANQQLANDDVQITQRYRERGYVGVERSSQTVVQVISEGEARRNAAEQTVVAPSDNQQTVATPAPVPAPAPLPATPQFPPPAPLPSPTPVAPPDGGELTAAFPPPSTLPAELANSGLDQKYDIIRKAGEGGMGAVYLAFSKDDPDHEQPLALKVVLDVAKSKDAAARFKREILATSFCAHETIIEIHDAAPTDDGSYYMAMEYIEGEELADIIKAEGPLSMERMVRLLDQALQALQAAHEANIVHRDIKPQNFRIAKRADGSELLKLVDFGIARVLDAADSGAGDQFFKTMGGKITGSPAYIAPESITEPEIDQRADLYSLGITIFRVVTGRLPFVAKAPTEYLPMHLYQKPPRLREVLPTAPEAVEFMVDKLLAKVADNRYQSAAEALAFLREHVWPAVLPDEPVPGSPEAEAAKAAAEAAAAAPPPAAPPPPDLPAPPPLPGVPAPLPLPGAPPSPPSYDPLAPPPAPPPSLSADNLGFTAPEMAVPSQAEIDGAPEPAPPPPADAAAPPPEGGPPPEEGPGEPEPKKPGFFARLWASIFGSKKS